MLLLPRNSMMNLPHGRPRAGSPRVVATIAALAMLTVTMALAQQQQPTQTDSPSLNQPRPWANQDSANRLPDANERMEMQDQHSKKAKTEAANAARRKQIADDAARLLLLATELKAAVEKTDKDTLSLDVIRKADSIERLAKGVKEKMKLSVGAS